MHDNEPIVMPCVNCDGTGKLGALVCAKCEGTGELHYRPTGERLTSEQLARMLGISVEELEGKKN
jgi:hypothetical protein